MRAILFTISTGALLAVAGCGGGAPLLHGAHVLSPETVRFGAGLSANVLAGSPNSAIEAERAATAAGMTGLPDRAQIKASAVGAQVGLMPGLTPFVGARIGLAGDNEAGLSYYGRSVRVDIRHAFVSGATACSVGLGATGALYKGDGGQAGLTALSYDAKMYGLDVPILVGWQSQGQIATVWAGARAGYRKTDADLQLDEVADLGAWSVGGLVGLSVGFRHVHGLLELEVDYQKLSGSVAGVPVSLGGAVFTPAGALAITF